MKRLEIFKTWDSGLVLLIGAMSFSATVLYMIIHTSSRALVQLEPLAASDEMLYEAVGADLNQITILALLSFVANSFLLVVYVWNRRKRLETESKLLVEALAADLAGTPVQAPRLEELNSLSAELKSRFFEALQSAAKIQKNQRSD